MPLTSDAHYAIIIDKLAAHELEIQIENTFVKNGPFLEKNRTSSLQCTGNISLLPSLPLLYIPQ